MRERPILFSSAMVRALLKGTKTQTRRIVKTQPPSPKDVHALAGIDYSWIAPDPPGLDYHRPAGPVWAVRELMGREPQLRCPYGQPGDRLWVRETFVQGFPYDSVQDRHLQYDEDGNELQMKTWYRATDSGIGWADDDGFETNVPWRPSIHMPRAVCRLVLEITGVRIERLQDISEADAIAEGCTNSLNLPGGRFARENFAHLWWTIHGDDSWESNPWVWAVEFCVLANPEGKHGGGDGHAA
ncbi:hypothetical protein [Achromobacter mucicolens]|uniref:hypothetical protein n=1 Tax=Achromobacter mucicolens TaxID=1389922 RepID=UPI0028A21631|nr:hypothetical protein [Achromobacter mucicolens]